MPHAPQPTSPPAATYSPWNPSCTRVARGRAVGAACPDCDRFSDRVHDRYQRRLKDLPLAELGFVIRLTVRRFICGAADSPRRTYAEPFSWLAAPHARFTIRLNHALERVGLAPAGRAGPRLAARWASAREG
ncbi:transposase family protein [Streptomyces sp. NPDC058655]|uniref:transposase family protein n=1 Tax=unclassified Streptomyces TaxID=2593676 RepID=UPI00364D381B